MADAIRNYPKTQAECYDYVFEVAVIRSRDDQWMRVLVESGDLIVVPKDRYHRFAHYRFARYEPHTNQGNRRRRGAPKRPWHDAQARGR
ncbi:MAG: hypothetical protein JRJ24_12010 [Deltaproteobacteria bacterium]|nr:hypothetical protein [Deltaproteobacteria bacterium]MBW1906011.1 hypothetical protein [Deltaproteobacteria bacterium]